MVVGGWWLVVGGWCCVVSGGWTMEVVVVIWVVGWRMVVLKNKINLRDKVRYLSAAENAKRAHVG